jgi:carbon-monoxide dehydrogenase large subunit
MSAGRRREDARLVTGRGRYVSTIRRDGMLHCAFARSSIAHGEIEGIDVDVRRSGVTVLRATDLGLPTLTGRAPGLDNPVMARPPLANDRVRYVGEPVAVALSADRGAAVDVAGLVRMDIAPLRAVVGIDAALEGDTLLFDAAGDNVVGSTHVGDGDADLGRWPVCIDVTLDNQRLAPMAIEPLAIVAEPDGEGGLTVWCGHQAPHRLKGQLSRLLGIDRVRVIVPDVGGAFGMKGMLFPEYVVVAACALQTGRPVAWTETRTEHFLGGTHGRSMRHRVRLAGERNGRLRAADIEIVADLGAYPHNGARLPSLSAWVAQGAYDLERLRVRTTSVVTNCAPTGSYRGAGRPEAAYAMERAVDVFAEAAGVDAVTVRRASLIPSTALPYRTRTGALYDSGEYATAMERALELVGVDEVRRAQTAPADGAAHGVGVAVFIERAGGQPDSSEYARVELTADGPVARVGTADSGQGHATVWGAVVAEVLGADPDDVAVVTGDTDEVAEGTGTFASRSAQLAGSALHRTAGVVRERVAQVAGAMLEVDARDLEVNGASVRVAGDPTTGVTMAAVIERATEDGVELVAEETWSAHAQTFPYGAYAAVVSVDLATGLVTLRRIVAVDDCGRVLHPAIVEGQTHGSLAQGIGQALYEQVCYAPDGQPQVSSLVDYLAPTAPDLPAYITDRLVSPAPSNPLGVKGGGEAGCIGAPPAIVNAALDALRPHGVTHLDMPLHPQQVWRALQAARTGDAPRTAG